MNDNNNNLAIQLEAVINTAIDGIITIDSKGIVEMINPSAAILFQYNPEEVIGQNINILMPQPYKREHDEYLDNYNKTKIPKIIGIGREVVGLKKDGTEFPLRLGVSEVILHNRVIFTGIIHDLTKIKEAQNEIISLNKKLEEKVTQRTYELEKVVNTLLATNSSLENEVFVRKATEDKLKENEEELIQALEKEKELNELKSRFVSMASHEFRTPLASILSSAAIIGKYDKTDQQPNREKHIKRIKSAVANLTGILNDFLSLSKLEEGKVSLNYSELNLVSLCEDVVEETKGLLKSNQNINHKVIGEPSHVMVDERILKNILFNLISNAIKYSEDQIDCIIEFHDDKFQIKVKDNGIGIPIEDQKHLFSQFFRAGNVTNIQGTGLGLNIVKRYVNLLKGEIDFESIPEVGSTFYVTIPHIDNENLNNS